MPGNNPYTDRRRWAEGNVEASFKERKGEKISGLARSNKRKLGWTSPSNG
jgi:hypothetical protein